MSATASHSLADRTPASFEEFRALWESEDPQKGFAGLLQRWIARLLNALVALLAEVRAAEPDEAPGAQVAAADVGADNVEATVGPMDCGGAGGEKPVVAAPAADAPAPIVPQGL